MQEKINRTVGALDLPQRYAGKRKERGSRFAFAPKKKKWAYMERIQAVEQSARF